MEEIDDLVKEFLVEAHEGLDQLDRDLVELEKESASGEVLGRVFRIVHTIKGSSGFLALDKLGAVAHVGENLLSLLREGAQPVTEEITSALLAMADAIREILEHVERGHGEGETDWTPLVQQLTRLAEAAPAPVEHADGAAMAVQAPAPLPADDEAPPEATPAETVADELRTSVAENSIRVDVTLLDTLMNLVGELVLARNQILQFTSSQHDTGFVGTCQRLNLVTTELQEGVMKTRMQQIGSVWTKFPRLVRDLALACGKRVRIEMEGRHTELDKTIIESIKDPLLHAIRNSVDHGIELPEVRRARGKPDEGCIQLRAFHEGGQVNIEIVDDGGGIDPQRVRERAIARGVVAADRLARMSDREIIALVTLPGFSTAEKITSVSGRGVGMDVVKTNIEKIGGSIDIHSVVGKGTTIRIKIPLTLAIIPALIVASGGERFAIPQVNLLELVRLDRAQAQSSIEHIHGAPVYRLRGNLLPLAYLDAELGHAATTDRDESYIVVLKADDQQFGLVVESVLDTEEIVVKPLGKQLKGVPAFAGAAIMGDGRVALILDVVGLAQTASLIAERNRTRPPEAAVERAGDAARATLLLLAVGDRARVAVDLATVARLEELATADIERTAGREVVQYRGEILPLLRLATVLSVPFAGDADAETVQVVVVRGRDGRCVGLVVERILDIVEERVDTRRHRFQAGIKGAITLQGRVTDLLDVEAILDRHLSEFCSDVDLVGGGVS